MADNVELNSGSGGAVIATDDVGGIHYQIVKLAYGALEAADIVSDSNPLPIDDAGGAITVDGTVTAELSAVDNAVLDQIELNTDFGVVVGGGVQATALRVTIASDSTGVLSVDDNGAALTVDNGGTFAVQAEQSGTWNVTDISGTVSLPTGAATAANQATIIGHVDGLEGLLTTIDADTSTLAGAVNGTEMQVDILTIAAGDNNIGNVDIASAIPAGTNNIGDVDVLTIAAGTNLIGNVGIGVRTSGGATPVQFLDVDETEDEVKGSAGQLYFIHAMNLANAKRYLKVYDETAASCDVGTDTPKFTFTLPTQGDTNGAGFTVCFPMGIAFGTGICIAATTGFAVADTGAPGANEIIVNVAYN